MSALKNEPEMQIRKNNKSINSCARKSAKETGGVSFFEEKLEKKRHKVDKKDTSWEGEGQKRHKLDVRVVPFGGKKGTSQE